MIRIVSIFILLLVLVGCSSQIAIRTNKSPNYHSKTLNNKALPNLKNYSSRNIKKLYNILLEKPKYIYDLSRNDVLNLLGNPIIIKNNKSLIIWQYRSQDCSINILWTTGSYKDEDNNSIKEDDTIEIGRQKFKNSNFNTDHNNNILYGGQQFSHNDEYSLTYLTAITDKSHKMKNTECFLTIYNEE